MSRKNKDGLRLIILTGIVIVLSLGLFLNSCDNNLMETVEKDVLAAGPAATYTVMYDGNDADGGSVPVDSNRYAEGAPVDVAIAGTMSRTNYTFIGWNTAKGGSGTASSLSV